MRGYKRMKARATVQARVNRDGSALVADCKFDKVSNPRSSGSSGCSFGSSKVYNSEAIQVRPGQLRAHKYGNEPEEPAVYRAAKPYGAAVRVCDTRPPIEPDMGKRGLSPSGLTSPGYPVRYKVPRPEED